MRDIINRIAFNERNPVDYVFISVDKCYPYELRADLLDEWKAGKGPNRTRRVHFQVNSIAQAENLLTEQPSQ